MNGLALRINKVGGKKAKGTVAFAPVVIPNSVCTTLREKNTLFKIFLHSSIADEQLTTLKSILDENKDTWHDDTTKFLVLVFFHAENKHPVKCFLTRHITKNTCIQEQFSKFLAEEISTTINSKHVDYKDYLAVVSKVAACVENFSAGANGVKLVEIELADYLKSCLKCCVETLRETQTLSPTEKNEIFNLAHLDLRLVLYIVQKISNKNVQNLTSMFKAIRMFINNLLFDEDTPMDTKSVCGILYLSMHVLENGSDSWIDMLHPAQTNCDLNILIDNESAQLALYSAIVIVVSAQCLHYEKIYGKSAIIELTSKILAIGERSSFESTFILGVTRTLVQISKTLDKLVDHSIGLKLVDSLLVFVWAHLEHYMDSVRHLTAQMLSNIVKYCTKLKIQDDDRALNNVFTALASLDRSRKSYYVSLTALTVELGALAIIEKLPTVISDVIAALNLQAVQASATTALEFLLQKHIQESNTESVYNFWVQPILVYVAANTLDSGVLNILENLLTKTVKLNGDVINYIKSRDVKCILMLLSVARKSDVTDKLASKCEKEQWKGIIRYEVLEMAAVSPMDETRMLSLSLIVESPKSTEPFTQCDLNFVLYYLKYNINAQSPNFRQLTLSMMKKFIKRFDDSYKVLRRLNKIESNYYVKFLEDLRAQCFDSLIPGANYSRRFVALQMLLWCEHLHFDGYNSIWNKDYIEKLLLHLEDSYENNKAFALEVLNKCPADLLKSQRFSMSLEIEDILLQASSLKPTECISAAYKLDLLRNKLPDYIVQEKNTDIAEPVTYALLQRLHTTLREELAVGKQSIVMGALKAPMYGLLHCMVHLIARVDVSAISNDAQWGALVSAMITTCVEVNAVVACVVNNSSPEGHLPMDMTGIVVSDHGNSGGVKLEDGRQVTSQMVLLCAWRSVKEVSLLLGEISSRLSIAGEGSPCGTLTSLQLLLIGEHFTQLLAETKHRGAFEQAYVGFTKLLARLWRCRSPALHELPRTWLTELMAAIASGDKRDTLCATRRSAGLPFMIQALVTTELQVQGNPKCFHQCMATLLQLASNTTTTDVPKTVNNEIVTHPHGSHAAGIHVRKAQANVTNAFEPAAITAHAATGDTALTHVTGIRTIKAHETITNCAMDPDSDTSSTTDAATDAAVEARAHSTHILRALFRNAALDESGAGYAGVGLLRALRGFEGGTWVERNSSTLLFSALMVRIFGVQRSRDADNLCVRNRMTGRIFFLRYPQLYDFMLEKLKDVSSSEDTQIVRPSLYPILLLLARLYPSSLEGTVSHLKLVAYVPHVLSCAKSSVLKTRQLAAKAMVPYVPHLEAMFLLICDKTIKRNYCHGILLQLIRLLDAKPETLAVEKEATDRLQDSIRNSLWILDQAVGHVPCYLLADEYVKVVNLLIWRFPALICQETIIDMEAFLEKLLFNGNIPKINSGRDVCLANALYIYFIILSKYNTVDKICDLIYKSISHKSYEVVLTMLNYLLILYHKLNLENKFQEHLSIISNRSILQILRGNNTYIQSLCNVLKNNKYFECTQKTLKVLTLENDTEKYVIQMKVKGTDMSDEIVINTLYDCIQDEHQNSTHIYLESLSKFVTKKLKDSSLNGTLILHVIRMIFACSSSDNSDDTRSVVVGFLERNCDELMNINLDEFVQEEKFEYKSTLYATIVRVLEDDDATLRQRTANVVAKLTNTSEAISSKAADALSDAIAGTQDGLQVFTVLALLDFKSEVCMTDEISDECRVFDQNERYNIFLEETVWTNACADRIIQLYERTDVQLIEFIQSVVESPLYRKTFDKLCSNNIVLFENVLYKERNKCAFRNNDVINPKIAPFINRLRYLCKKKK